jgi:hypothetical protein
MRALPSLVLSPTWCAMICLALCASGCASPIGRGWASYKDRREIERVAADDSFPSAEEVGLKMHDTRGS